MKKILLVTDVYNWGGHVRAQYIQKHLSDEFSFDIMDGGEFGKYSNYIINSPMINRDWVEKMNEKYDIIYLLFHTMLLRKDVTKLLKRNKKNILTAVTSYPVLRAGFLNVEKSKAKKSINMFLSRANNCVGIISNNYKSLEDLRSIYKGRTFYAPRGVDEKIFYPTKEFVQKPENEFTVAFVGKEGAEKGFDDIIKPACQIANVKLISNQRNYTNALTPDEMREFYNQADVYVVASISEGTPNTALEAAACGLPLVSNHVGNMPDLIENHKNSWLIKERELHKYYNRLVWLKNNQKTAWEFGQRIREAVLKDWTWDKVLNKNERMIFRELLLK